MFSMLQAEREPLTFTTQHFWTNFELGDLDFFRSDDYQSFFQHLDKSGGFYYERVGQTEKHQCRS